MQAPEMSISIKESTFKETQNYVKKVKQNILA